MSTMTMNRALSKSYSMSRKRTSSKFCVAVMERSWTQRRATVAFCKNNPLFQCRHLSQSTDPHAEAAARIAADSTSERLQAGEALGRVDKTIRLQNVALATALAGFVTGVWWYSSTAVGGGGNALEGEVDGALQELEEAASQARKIRAEKETEEKRLQDLLDEDEEEEGYDDLEPSSNIKRRPLWRRIVFFWKS